MTTVTSSQPSSRTPSIQRSTATPVSSSPRDATRRRRSAGSSLPSLEGSIPTVIKGPVPVVSRRPRRPSRSSRRRSRFCTKGRARSGTSRRSISGGGSPTRGKGRDVTTVAARGRRATTTRIRGHGSDGRPNGRNGPRKSGGRRRASGRSVDLGATLSRKCAGGNGSSASSSKQNPTPGWKSGSGAWSGGPCGSAGPSTRPRDARPPSSTACGRRCTRRRSCRNTVAGFRRGGRSGSATPPLTRPPPTPGAPRHGSTVTCPLVRRSTTTRTQRWNDSLRRPGLPSRRTSVDTIQSLGSSLGRSLNICGRTTSITTWTRT
mmetsp:Transcript_31139/g.66304  ORF Transcript_31139/g.66304 Transcript_31139/m.66304 type:complete len:319 (+) Transcript_31139:252-1208(+)